MSTIEFSLNGQACSAQPGETILQAARRAGAQIPTLCHSDRLTPAGNCRACVVEVAGERVLAASCCRTVQPGMQVQTESPRAKVSQNMVLEMLLADMPEHGYQWLDDAGKQAHGELSAWAAKRKVQARPALQALKRQQPAADLSHPAMAVNLDACIQCDRCVRACRDEQVNDVLGTLGRGASSQIILDLADPMGTSTCVGCGECVQACPTGALSAKSLIGSQTVDREIPSVCPYCGVGCQLTYQVRGEKIVAVQGRDGPANEGRLCVKGRFGFDYIHHPGRLTQPLRRKPGVPKQVRGRDEDWRDTFEPVSWEEALSFAAQGLDRLRKHSPQALAGFGSAKGSNEEAYLFQKLVRTQFGSHNVDHCTRLCHASSVTALLEGVGSGAVSNPAMDVLQAEVVLLIGSNPTANHPVAASFMKNAAKRGTKIILADPRRTAIARHAWRVMQFKPDTDVLLLNAMIQVIFEQNQPSAAVFSISDATHLEALKTAVQPYTPEAVAPLCGVDAATIRECAQAFAQAKGAMILWGMGVSQHVHGTDNARCLIALSAVAGQIGKPGSGLHPLRGQNNVQGASDAGLIPMMLPNYARVSEAQHREWFEGFWGTLLAHEPGLTVVEILDHALLHKADPRCIRGLYVMGENPAMSDPDLNHAREALAALDHLVVQDIFMTETAWMADVILPASAWPEKWGTVTNTDRIVQMGRRAVQPPGDAKPDLWIIQQLAQRLAQAPEAWQYAETNQDDGAGAVFEEMRQAMGGARATNPFAGISWKRLQTEHAVTYPCDAEDEPGHAIIFTDGFPTPSGKAKLVPAAYQGAAEKPDADYPLTLITGRLLEHWHTGSMTRRASALDALEPMATVSLNPKDALELGLCTGSEAHVSTRRGEVLATVRVEPATPVGSVFMPFAFEEAAANLLTHAALDPLAKIPEFKACAVRVRAVAPID